MYGVWSREFETRDECLRKIAEMYRAIEETGFCEMAVLDETLCTNPHEWGWTSIGTVKLCKHGTEIRITDRPTARSYEESVSALDISGELLKILLDDNVTHIWMLMEAYRSRSLRQYAQIGPAREREIMNALDEWQRKTI